LEENNFEISNSSKYFLTFDGKQYSNQKIDNIYDLYDFKRKLISEDVIAPAQNDIIQNESTILDFTPIKLSEFYKENYLFPPKSTWISPRI
jgi:transcriptional regulator of aromatic amino acid metabolism